ncbi:MAG: transketolase, partial [Acidimicrobiia bacterium]|nr:transketolase [Acidimicrobiia bacterium]
HQPIEHLASLRAMPNMWVFRPADAGETVECWELALNRTDGPSCILTTRQDLPVLDRSGMGGAVARGGYVLRDGTDVVLVATGSEVALALEAADLLDSHGTSARVVSLPCWELFFVQDATYRESVLGTDIPRVSIEAASTFGWDRIVGADGFAIGLDRFGASAPAEVLAEEFGFTARHVFEQVTDAIAGRRA